MCIKLTSRWKICPRDICRGCPAWRARWCWDILWCQHGSSLASHAETHGCRSSSPVQHKQPPSPVCDANPSKMLINPQPVTWGPFGPHSGLMAVYFRSPGGSTTPFKVVVRPPNVYEEVCLFFRQGFHNVRRMQVWCGVQMDSNVSNVLVLVYLILFPGNNHFLFC